MVNFNPDPPHDITIAIEDYAFEDTKCYLSDMKNMMPRLLESLHNDDLLDKASELYKNFDNVSEERNRRAMKTNDKDTARYHFLKMKNAFLVVKSHLYGTIGNAAATAGATSNQDISGSASVTIGGSDTPAVARSVILPDTDTDSSTPTDRAGADAVAKTSSVLPSTKTKATSSTRTVRSSQLRGFDENLTLREGEEKGMHHIPKRRPGDEFRGGAVNPEKAHFQIGERGLPGRNERPTITEELSHERDQSERVVNEAEEIDMSS